MSYSSLLAAAQSESKALYRFLSADEIKKTAVCVWCAFQQRDLPVSSRYGLRGEFLWGGLNSSLSSFPPPLPSILAEHKQLAGLAARRLYNMFATALLTGNNKPRSKVKRDCGARILVCSSGNHCCAQAQHNGAHSIAGRHSESQGEHVGSEHGWGWGMGGDYPGASSAKMCWTGPRGLHEDVKVWPIGLEEPYRHS